MRTAQKARAVKDTRVSVALLVHIAFSLSQVLRREARHASSSACLPASLESEKQQLQEVKENNLLFYPCHPTTLLNPKFPQTQRNNIASYLRFEPGHSSARMENIFSFFLFF